MNEKYQGAGPASNHSAVFLRSPRMSGKNTIMLSEFFSEGKKGKSVIFSTPEGDFLSPKAVDNLLQAERDRIRKMVEGKKKEIYRNATNSKDKEIFDRSYGYNQALNDLLADLEKQKAPLVFGGLTIFPD